MKSKLISISAISSALIAIILTVGAYFEITDVFCVIISSVFVILPIYYKSKLGCFLTYLAGGILAFMFSGFNVSSIVFPAYFAFFGLYPIIKFIITDSKFNKWLGYVLCAIWCVGAIYGLYFYYTMLMRIQFLNLPPWIMDNILYLIAPLSLVLFVLYDRVVYLARKITDRYLGRIVK